MAKYILTYTPDGKVKKELTYKNEVFSYTMIPDEHGKTGDNVAFEMQVSEKFPNESEEVLCVLDEISFADEDDIETYLSILSNSE
jgi:uncharacterized protein YrzB (UPF0473 family)